MPKSNRRIDSSQVMAEREYVCARVRLDGSDPTARITVRIAFPQQRSDGRYECLTEIDSGENTEAKPINGVDAFEAIQLALIYIGVNLWSFSGRGEDELTWLEGKRGDLAFPTPPDLSMDPIMNPRKS
jgi:hypothetical protein